MVYLLGSYYRRQWRSTAFLAIAIGYLGHRQAGTVSEGTVIGYTGGDAYDGDLGTSTGAHCHVEYWPSGYYAGPVIDPYARLTALGVNLMLEPFRLLEAHWSGRGEVFSLHQAEETRRYPLQASGFNASGLRQ